MERETHFFRKTTAREELFPSPSSELSLPLSTVSEPQSSSSSSSSLEDDSSCQREKNSSTLAQVSPHTGVHAVLSVIHSHMACWPLTPDPLADFRNLLASDEASGFFFRKDLAETPSSPASPSLSEDEPSGTNIRMNFRDDACTCSILPLLCHNIQM